MKRILREICGLAVLAGWRSLQKARQGTRCGAYGPECEETGRINGSTAPFEWATERIQIDGIENRKEDAFRNSGDDKGRPEDPDEMFSTHADSLFKNLCEPTGRMPVPT